MQVQHQTASATLHGFERLKATSQLRDAKISHANWASWLAIIQRGIRRELRLERGHTVERNGHKGVLGSVREQRQVCWDLLIIRQFQVEGVITTTSMRSDIRSALFPMSKFMATRRTSTAIDCLRRKRSGVIHPCLLEAGDLRTWVCLNPGGGALLADVLEESFVGLQNLVPARLGVAWHRLGQVGGLEVDK